VEDVNCVLAPIRNFLCIKNHSRFKLGGILLEKGKELEKDI
jgi:hypothetical protein